MPPAGVHARSLIGVDHADGRAEWQRVGAQLPQRGWRTRFAPAPTGYLHLGHVINALYVWGMARRFGGHVILRIEDHDRSRCRREYESALLDDLEWLGFEPDIASVASYRARPTDHPHRQADNPERYAAALALLAERELVYPCMCTRRDVATRVPHAAGDEPRYPGTCRDRGIDPNATQARRLRVDSRVESFHDLRLGAQAQNPEHQCGDFLLRDRLGSWTYQFAVVVDDMAHAVDLVIRGEDLLSSTARQFQLARLLGRESAPLVLHHPLLVHADGVKLSKANRDTSLRARRARGDRPEALLGEAACLAGLTTTSAPLAASEVASLFGST